MPRHPRSQGSVERANSDIRDMLVAWTSDSNAQDWRVRVKFVQNQKNFAHAGTNRTPYKGMFGEDPKLGLTPSSLVCEMLESLQSEDDLPFLCPPSEPLNQHLMMLANNPLPLMSHNVKMSVSHLLLPVGHNHHLQSTSTRRSVPVQYLDSPSPQSTVPLDKRLVDITSQHKRASDSQLSQAEKNNQVLQY